MTSLAHRERLALADLLFQLGPDAPTLCEGWTTRDLAAHLVVRERRPDAMADILFPPLRGRGERIRQAKAAQPYDAILREVRTAPWWSPLSNPLTDEAFNAVEFFIHHEDARRGGALDWQPRALAAADERVIWRTIRHTGRLALRRLGVPVRVRPDGLEPFEVGPDPQLTITGPPSELALFLSGRQRAARVTVEGPAGAVQRVRQARLGV